MSLNRIKDQYLLIPLINIKIGNLLIFEPPRVAFGILRKNYQNIVNNTFQFEIVTLLLSTYNIDKCGTAVPYCHVVCLD